MPDHPVKPPPPHQGDKVEMSYGEFSQAVDDVLETAGPPEIQTDPISRYRPTEKTGLTFSEICHAVTLAAVLGILALLCITTARNESRYQKAVQDAEAVRERLKAAGEASDLRYAESMGIWDALHKASADGDEKAVRRLYREYTGAELPLIPEPGVPLP